MPLCPLPTLHSSANQPSRTPSCAPSQSTRRTATRACTKAQSGPSHLEVIHHPIPLRLSPFPPPPPPSSPLVIPSSSIQSGICRPDISWCSVFSGVFSLSSSPSPLVPSFVLGASTRQQWSVNTHSLTATARSRLIPVPQPLTPAVLINQVAVMSTQPLLQRSSASKRIALPVRYVAVALVVALHCVSLTWRGRGIWHQATDSLRYRVHLLRASFLPFQGGTKGLLCQRVRRRRKASIILTAGPVERQPSPPLAISTKRLTMAILSLCALIQNSLLHAGGYANRLFQRLVCTSPFWPFVLLSAITMPLIRRNQTMLVRWNSIHDPRSLPSPHLAFLHPGARFYHGSTSPSSSPGSPSACSTLATRSERSRRGCSPS